MLQGILLVSRMIYLNYARVRCSRFSLYLSIYLFEFVSEECSVSVRFACFWCFTFASLHLHVLRCFVCLLLRARSCSCDGGMSVLEKMSVIFFVIPFLEGNAILHIFIQKRKLWLWAKCFVRVYRLRARIRTRARSFFFIIIIIAIRSRTVFAAATTHFHVNSKNFVYVCVCVAYHLVRVAAQPAMV